MRFLGLLKKAAIENWRDWKMLSLVVVFAPFFVFLMHAYFKEAADPHRLVIVNRDAGVEVAGRPEVNAGRLFVERVQAAKRADGRQLFRVEVSDDLDRARRRLEVQSVDVVLELPADLSAVLLAWRNGERPHPAVIRSYGNPANASYVSGAMWSGMLASEVAGATAGVTRPIVIQSEALGRADAPTEYDLSVPGLLALAVMMLMFTGAGSLIRENDQGTLVRLRMSRMTTLEWIAAVSVVQVVLGLVAVGLTLLTAVALGYRAAGNLAALTVVTALSSLSVMAVSVIVAAVLRTVFDLVTIGCFPFFILMFFSGGMFPLPRVRILELGTYTVHLNDVLPTTHAIAAYDRILRHHASLTDVWVETAAIVVLTAALFALGGWLFSRRHMRAA